MRTYLWLSSLHNYQYLEIPIQNIQLNMSWEGKEVLACFSSPNLSLSVKQLCKGQIRSWIITILDSFTPVQQVIHKDEGWGWWEPWSGKFFKLKTARWSLLRPVWALEVTNSMVKFSRQSCFISSWMDTCPVTSLPFEDYWTTCARQTGLRNKPQKKQTSESLAMIHTWIVSSLV